MTGLARSQIPIHPSVTWRGHCPSPGVVGYGSS